MHAVASLHPDLVFCLESAAALWGLPVFGDPEVVHVLATPEATARLHGGIRVHTTGSDRDIARLGGLLLTDIRDVVVDIARSRHRAVGLTVADAALRNARDLSVEVLIATNEARSNSRGRRIARWSLSRATPLAESPLESISRAAVEWLGFESPELQREFRTGDRLDRSDMWWESALAIGEADGDVKYDGSLGDPATAIRAEKDRDRRLSAHAHGIAHWGWNDVARSEQLRQSLLSTGMTQRHPADSLQLRGLRELLLPRNPSPTSRETALARRD